MKRKNLIFLACLLVWVYGCGAIDFGGEKNELTITEDLTDVVNRCRISSQQYVRKHYKGKMPNLGGLDSEGKIPKLSIAATVKPKYPCQSSFKSIDRLYAEKIRKVSSEFAKFEEYDVQAVEKAVHHYNLGFSSFLNKFENLQGFYPVYIESIKAYFSNHSGFIEAPIFDFKKLRGMAAFSDDEIANRSRARMSLNDEKRNRNVLILNFDYYFLSNIADAWEKEPAGKDQIYVAFKKTGPNVSITITQLEGKEYRNAVNFKGLLGYIQSISNAKLMQYGKDFRNFDMDFIKPFERDKDILKIRYDDLKKEYSSILNDFDKSCEKISANGKLLSKIENQGVYCYLLLKNLKIFESARDVKIIDIKTADYKTKTYIAVSLFYLNILNNVNIKLNDQYKIARYLFDNIVRKGIREFSAGLRSDEIDGVSFEVRATDRSFVNDEKDPNVSLYSFYLPKNEIMLYVNDDITGKKLADRSYILVNGERIHLR